MAAKVVRALGVGGEGAGRERDSDGFGAPARGDGWGVKVSE